MSETNIEETTKDVIGTDASSPETEVPETTHIVSDEEKSEKNSEELKSSETLLAADSPDKEEEVVESMSEEKAEATLSENEEKRDIDSAKASTSSKEAKAEAVAAEPQIKDSSKSSNEGKVGLRGKSYSPETADMKDSVSEEKNSISKLDPDDGAIIVVRRRIKAMPDPSEAESLFEKLLNLIR